MFDKSRFLDAVKPKTTTVQVEGFGDVSIKQLSVDDMDNLRSIIKDDGKEKFGLELLRLTIIDEDGKQVLTEEDIPTLKAARNDLLDNPVSKAMEFNGLLKAQDSKNLETTPSVDSSTDSPSN